MNTPNYTDDRATRYALDVISGKIIAGPHVRDACQRHLNDFKRADECGFYYDYYEAAEAIAFPEECLCLNGGQFEGKPFLLIGWQDFVYGNIYGWLKTPKNATRVKRPKDNNTSSNPWMWKDNDSDEEVLPVRRFQVAYIETPKGSGKSPLAASMGLKGLIADNEPRAEIYAAATFREQAMVLFRDAVAFFDQSPALQDRLVVSGTGAQRWNLAYPAKSSFFRAISSEKKGQSGPRPSVVLLDEIHEHRDGTVIEMLRAGFKFRRQPLSVMITNSGHDKTSVCWEYHEMGTKIAAMQLENDAFFAFICSLDEEDLKDDAFLDDETLWPKVNPSLQEANIPGYDYIREQVKEAKGMPSKMATVKRLSFCVWTEGDNPWISGDVWMAGRDEDFDDSLLLGRRCTGGLDLSSTTDLTALALLFEPIEADPVHRLLVYFWLPGDGLQQKADKDRVPYIAWRDAGHLTTLDGRAVNKLAVLREIVGVVERYKVICIAYDRWGIKDLKMLADNEGIEIDIGVAIKDDDGEIIYWKFMGDGIPMREFGQGYREMGPAVNKFEIMLLDRQVKHNGSPLLTWNAANAVTQEDTTGWRKVAKNKSTGRVDGIVAAVMACGISGMKTDGESVYESRGIISV